MITLYDIVSSVEWDQLIPLFPEDNLNNFEKAFNCLKTLYPIISDPPDMYIDFHYNITNIGNYKHYEIERVCGVSENEHYNLNNWDWEEWLALPISQEILKIFTKPTILTHCLWEMTYFGYSPEEIDAYFENKEG